MNDSRGQVLHVGASNRAGFASDAITDGALLAQGASKTIAIVSAVNITTKPTVVDANGNSSVDNTQAGTVTPKPAVASSLWIKNSSGQTCALVFTVMGDGSGKLFDVSRNPVRLADGESMTVTERVVQIKETNIGGGAQTGMGVRYYATLEPSYR